MRSSTRICPTTRFATSPRSRRRPPTRWARWSIPRPGSSRSRISSSAADIKMTHVPYRGQTPAITDVLSGQIPLAFTTTAGVTDLVETGKLNLLATFGRERDEQFPNTPTPTEAGYPSVVVVGWSGLLAPAGTPPRIIAKLHSGMLKALAMPDVKDAILKQGSKAVSSRSPEEFARYIKSESEKFHPVIKAAGLEGSQ